MLTPSLCKARYKTLIPSVTYKAKSGAGDGSSLTAQLNAWDPHGRTRELTPPHTHGQVFPSPLQTSAVDEDKLECGGTTGSQKVRAVSSYVVSPRSLNHVRPCHHHQKKDIRT